jgi:hypothetical protein
MSTPANFDWRLCCVAKRKGESLMDIDELIRVNFIAMRGKISPSEMVE